MKLKECADDNKTSIAWKIYLSKQERAFHVTRNCISHTYKHACIEGLGFVNSKIVHDIHKHYIKVTVNVTHT